MGVQTECINKMYLIISVMVMSACANRLADINTVEGYTDLCLDGKQHKTSPGPEGELFGLCTPYKAWSCCTQSVAQSLHQNGTWYKFNWSHCKDLSPKCKAHFQRDLCFYECSPNVGPWLAQEERSWRRERVYKAPLCNSECTQWFEDCKNDMTCVKNWARDFSWFSGRQQCPQGTGCAKIVDLFNSPKEFCEKVWDEAWEVVPDDQDCMFINFDSGDMDHNRAVARARAEQLINGKTSEPTSRAHTHGLSLGIILLTAGLYS